MKTWPTLLDVPMVDSYALQPKSGALRTDMDSGRTRKRKRFTTSHTDVTLQWAFTLDQFAIFEYFYEVEIADGTDWFLLPLANGQGVIEMEARFREDWQGALDKSCCNWRVSTTLELRKRPIYSSGSYAAAVAAGGANKFIASALSIYQIINAAIPAAQSR